MTVYRKPTHSGVFTHFTSFVPYPFKVGLIYTLLTRAYCICSNWTLFHHQIERPKNMLMMNGNTSQLFESKLNVFLNNKFKLTAATIMMKRSQVVIKSSGQISLKCTLNSHKLVTLRIRYEIVLILVLVKSNVIAYRLGFLLAL